MFGMLLVNFLGGYAICPRILKHTHDYCSYADTIMPQFLFAAGFAMRLSLGKRREAGGAMPWGRAVRRIFGLALVAIAWYTIGDWTKIVGKFQSQPVEDVLLHLFKREYFQTLLHIAATSLWILPVVTASWQLRVGYTVFSGILHVLVSWWFNFDWVYADPVAIDGGPLGFLTWAVPALCGTLACDAVRKAGPAAARGLAICGVGVMLLGWMLSMGTVLYNVHADPMSGSRKAVNPSSETPGHTASSAARPRNAKLAPDPVIPSIERLLAWDGTIVELPFIPPPDSAHRKWNYWMMSQRSGTLSYPTFAAGVSLVIYALCLWICDAKGWRMGLFRTLGTNSLAAYILHGVSGWVVPPLVHSVWPASSLFDQKTTSILSAGMSFVLFTLFVYAICRFLEWRGWYLRV
jgi:predicted acyltransferase